MLEMRPEIEKLKTKEITITETKLNIMLCIFMSVIVSAAVYQSVTD